MCGSFFQSLVGGGSSSSSPTPVPPVPQRTPDPPPVPQRTDPAVRRARQTARRQAAAARGRDSTLLGGQLQTEPRNVARKSLLGQ